MERTWLSTREAAAALGVSPVTIKAWKKRGLLTPWQVGPKGRLRFERAEVERVKGASREAGVPG